MLRRRVYLVLTLLLLVAPALAQPVAETPKTPNAGDTAWMLTSTALVLFMTIPGLTLFYAGLVRSKNVLSVMMQCMAITSLVTVKVFIPPTVSTESVEMLMLSLP